MISTVILDWSGVVSNDWQATFLAGNDVLEERGYQRLSEQKFRELYELPWHRFYEKQGIKVEPEDERERWERLFPKYYGRIKAFPFAKKTICRLKKQGKKVIVFSSHNQSLLEKEAEEYGLKGFIDFIYGGMDDKREKIVAMIARHEIEKKNTIFLGDMCHDIETAKHAGIRSVAVLSGYDTKERLEKAKPDFIIKDLGELPALIKKLEGNAND